MWRPNYKIYCCTLQNGVLCTGRPRDDVVSLVIFKMNWVTCIVVQSMIDKGEVFSCSVVPPTVYCPFGLQQGRLFLF